MHPRPDGSLPPSPRFLHEDPYSAARYAAGLPWIDRHMLDKRRQVIVDDLDALDAEGVEWMRRRRTVLNDALAMHEKLWPTLPGGWARRPPRPDQAPLPPCESDARPVRGVELRATSLRILDRHHLLCLRELHVLLHLYGFVIDSRTPVKALGDALGHEARAGRVERVARGWYRALVGDLPGRADPVLRAAPEDWYPGAVARLMSEPSAQREHLDRDADWAPRRRRPQPRPLARRPDRRAPIRAARRHW